MASDRAPDVLDVWVWLEACMGVGVGGRSVGGWESMPRAGHQSAGSFGWNVTQETHNGSYCMCCLDDCCLLAL